MVGWHHQLSGYEPEQTQRDRTGEPGVLQFMRLQRVRHNLVSEQQQTREHPHDGVLCSYEKDATELDTLMHKEETVPKECM